MVGVRPQAVVAKVVISTTDRAKRSDKACSAPVPTVAVAACKGALVLASILSCHVAEADDDENDYFKMDRDLQEDFHGVDPKTVD